MIIIIDYGMGNLGSVQNMFKRIGVNSQISGELTQIEQAEKILLPGIGSFDQAMKRISDSGLRDLLDKKATQEKIPVLGICLGMQLLTNSSEEGKLPGLGWINAKATRIPITDGLKVPHMGWNLVKPCNQSKLTADFPAESRFYFVHTYAVHCESPDNAILRTTHGVEFDAAIQHDNIYGVQFHPEKSHKFGMQLLKNFASL
jgi:imidazole glycerol-phosphate synthase subunit HisH